MKRRCIKCRAVIDTGSYCAEHARRWAPDPDRVRGRRNVTARARLVASQDGRCAVCGASGVPLERHHVDHDETNDAMGNVVALCRPCHRRSEHLA